MPELPEVETIKRFLEKAIVGQKIVKVEILSKKQFPGNPKEILTEKILGVDRRGKILIIRLSNEKNLLVHLKLSGQLIWAPKAGDRVTPGYPIPFLGGKELPGQSTRVIISINGGKLFFNEIRKFGWMKIARTLTLNKEGELAKLGPEPFSSEFNEDYFKKVFSKTSRPIKLILMDQEKIAGLGNIYANDALFEARIHPIRPANKLTDREIARLKKAILLVLKDGLAAGGTSEIYFVRPDGSRGEYQKHYRVYQRDGEKCSRCQGIIKRINLSGRGTFFCPRCQD